MGIKTRLQRILRVNAKQRDSIRKGVKALVYNEITEGEYKGWFKIEQLVPPEGVDVSVWSKEQEEYLDRRFLPLERDVKELKSDVKVLKDDVKVLKDDMKEVLGLITEMSKKINDNSKIVMENSELIKDALIANKL